MKCQCPAEGYCETLKRHMFARQHAICQGTAEGLTPAECGTFRRRWLAKAERDAAAEDPTLMGNQLKALADWLGFEHCEGCGWRRRAVNAAHKWFRKAARAIVGHHGTMAIITSYFNPELYPQLAANYRTFRGALGKLPLFTGEIMFHGAPPIGDGPVQLPGGPEHMLWQKERLLNLVVERLPARFDKVAWIDADILFRDAEWYDTTQRLLDLYPVVQLAETVVADGKRSATAAARGGEQPCKWGYAWAARREVFPLYDGAIVGGGDLLSAMGWLGRPCHGLTRSRAWQDHYERWAAEAHRKVGGRIGCLPGEIFHLDHGSHTGRQYNERYRLVAGLDPEQDLSIDASGLWTWQNEKYAEAVRGFFQRRQDG